MTPEETYLQIKNISHLPYIAIDVETANEDLASICQISIAWVVAGRVYGLAHLVNPLTKNFKFTYLHGITYDMVKTVPTFPEVWDTYIQPVLHTKVLAAHYANFDTKAIFYSYLQSGKSFNFEKYMVRDSCILARRYIPDLHNHKLPTVCDSLNIPLESHHNALNDAMACANIIDSFMAAYPDCKKYDMPFVYTATDETYRKFFFFKNNEIVQSRFDIQCWMRQNPNTTLMVRILMFFAFAYIVKLLF